MEDAPAPVEEVVAEPEPVAAAEDDVDYSNMSDDDVEAEIERLLAERMASDKKRRDEKIAAGEASFYINKSKNILAGIQGFTTMKISRSTIYNYLREFESNDYCFEEDLRGKHE